MNRPIGALQVPFHTEVDGDGVTMSVCRLDQVYYAKIKLQMKNGGKTVPASILPYVIVHATTETPDTWRVAPHPPEIAQRTPGSGTILIRVEGAGRYRLYIKEPTEDFPENALFEIQQHMLADGGQSGREVQPLVELDVNQSSDCTLSIRALNTNGLLRTRGTGPDSIPNDQDFLKFTDAHSSQELQSALDLGNHLISFQLWADASRTYGTQHPIVQGSAYREALTDLYSEGLNVGSGTGDIAHSRFLTFGGREVEFNHQSTTGGRGRLSFLADNGQPNNRMMADESLRRTHPATMEFLLKMMDDLDITYARVTGAWRPHVGSTRHRYASAIDLTHAKKTVMDENNQPQLVSIHFHSEDSAQSNPLGDGRRESPERTRMREFSYRVHQYIANARAQGGAGWLGGPWALTYGELGVGAADRPRDLAIRTDATHVHHLHISVGNDQP
ncbi:hypothetical protein [Stenotrophomonas sp. S39]|uniref:hypothetical protein n=1 Tax=Stenotrophomonas sp. S39 TaxID=2767451 RepID=UPI00190E59E5|nr:hypothetical protein [Stenotrophomonas sp. S39]MBK0056870.1 hypothetical protein [Stenotrophomonas sp. S39]